MSQIWKALSVALFLTLGFCPSWTLTAQQLQFLEGNKLVGSGASGTAGQGKSVDISADGNTAVFGGDSDNSQTGAAWVFTRVGGVWTQESAKLVGSGAIGKAGQGNPVAISGDGNTVVVGGSGDDGGIGAAWMFTRSGDVWTQQGTKLVAKDAVGRSGQGFAVAISTNGDTVLVGGSSDGGAIGAAWIFTRSNGVWTQQGNKLSAAGVVGASQGFSVSLSGDGNTALIGGPGDNIINGSSDGAAWVFTRSAGVWSQQGPKLVGTGATNKNAGQGWSVALSRDGNTAISGAPSDTNSNMNTGTAWVFTRTGTTWTQQGNKLVGTGTIGTGGQGWSVKLSGDGGTAIVGGSSDTRALVRLGSLGA
jgi:hypothetical protein